MADVIFKVYPKFDRKLFLSMVPELDLLELKPRVQRVRDQLKKQLPEDFKSALKILMSSVKAKTLNSFDLWPYTEFIQTHGLDEPTLSLNALKELTQLFTGEFAVRPFIKKYPKETIKYLLECATDPNMHIRRWASEGSRPRLPWGERLDLFIKDPRPTLPILEKLKYDPELYVRKSVANHLNDIAKDHPTVVIELLKKWQKSAPKTQQEKITWIIRQSLRTLIKSGNAEALALIGADHKIKIKMSPLRINKKSFKINERIEFNFEVKSLAKKSQKLVIDYIIHYVKSNQSSAPKVFKLKSIELPAGQKVSIQKNHHLKVVSTRRHYSGEHKIEIQINGKIQGQATWMLLLR